MKKLIASSVLAATAFAGIAAPAMADLSANVGYASEYYYRGILQKESSASAGIDFEQSGFYAGAWTADVGDGLEYDIYAGYGMEVGEVSLSAGFTGYYYTGEFDDTYEEFNFSAGWKFISVGYSVGEWDGFGEPADYDFLEVTVEHNGFYGTYGEFGDEAEGDYIELGYGAEVGGFDLGIAAIFSSEELSDQADSNGDDTESEAIIFSLSKTFDL
ncbi:hypothetical protein GP2143_15821 [marine gamma proteobacterium HTCC2143]|jgi:uncharacterized protein (TIGR02001 family)|uniref:Histidine kinase n=1 Tax=marine gamma proteobacterium HTCC2143 TaxID=247633 RepID=A0Y9D4_9GAMM|nr:hypothetical protein GP2143_15821 [marine gamma proteobacterium HTCC2143]|tara:strand:+ start:7541 stop:8185 length:645 start_codon:yes stop_codon:yes gene_type:complete